MRVTASTGTVGNLTLDTVFLRGDARPAVFLRGVVVVLLLRTRVACAKELSAYL